MASQPRNRLHCPCESARLLCRRTPTRYAHGVAPMGQSSYTSDPVSRSSAERYWSQTGSLANTKRELRAGTVSGKVTRAPVSVNKLHVDTASALQGNVMA